MTCGDKRWYGVRSIWRHKAPSGHSCKHLYEERIVLHLASDGEDAIARAENDDYLEDAEPIGYHMAFEIDGIRLDSGLEVFSLVRDSDLDADDYVDRIHDSGRERTR